MIFTETSLTPFAKYLLPYKPMFERIDNCLCLSWDKGEIEDLLDVSLTQAQFEQFVIELQDPDGTFEDMVLGMFDVILEEILAEDACACPV